MDYKDGNVHAIVLQHKDVELNIGYIVAWVKWDADFKVKDGSIGAWELDSIKHENQKTDRQHKGKHLTKSSFKFTNGEPQFIIDGNNAN